MSKKPVQSPPASAAAGDLAAAKLLCPARVDLDAAMKRLNPFIFAVDTDTKDTVDVRPLVASAMRDPAIAPVLVNIDRADAAAFVATLNDPSLTQLVTDAKAQQAAIAEGGGDPAVVAQCIRCRIVALAVEREEARLDEEDAAAARHAELVERLMEEGLTKSEAEQAAKEEEEGEEGDAAGGGDDDEEEGITRPQCFIMIKGFPNTADDVAALAGLGVPLDALFCLNSQARLGRRDEAPPVDPKAKGKKPEAKKADAKKGKGGKGAVEEVVAPTESVAQQLAKERTKIPVFATSHPLRHTAIWTYNVQCAEGKAPIVDDATGAKTYDLLESEAEVAEKLAAEVARTEQAAIDYRAWCETRNARNVARIMTEVEAKPAGEDAEIEAAAAAAAAEAAKAEAAAKAAAAATVPGKKGGAAAKGKGAVDEAPAQDTPASPPPPPPLPTSARAIGVDDELYRRLMEEVAANNATADVRMHCILEQVQDAVTSRRQSEAATDGTQSAAPTSAASVAETIAGKTRRDVADFCDYVLAQLDGTQDVVFEAARKRRLKAAEASGGSEENAEADSEAARAPLADAEYLRLVPATTRSRLDPDALLLGVPLRRIEARVQRALQAGALSDRGVEVAKTDLKSLETLEQAGKMFRHILVDRAGLSDGDAATILKARTQAQLLSGEALRDRLTELLRSEPGGKLYKATCEDGSYVLALVHTVPSERRRFASLWRAFHGHIPFPAWLEWADFVRAEDLFFNPPPRDDDDFDEDVDDEGDDEEEEEEEEEEIGVDEDGEPIMRKKPRKVVIHPPEYTNNDLTVAAELRRRANFEHFKRRVEQGTAEELLLADNHTSNLLHVETSTLYPSDGAVIVSQNVTGNQRTFHCTAYAETGVSFGVRATMADDTADKERALKEADERAAEEAAAAAAAAAADAKKTPKTSPRGQQKGGAAAVGDPAKSTEASPVEVDEAADGANAHAHESGPKPVASGVSIVGSLGDEAHFHVTATCPVAKPAAARPQRGTVPPSGNATPPPAGDVADDAEAAAEAADTDDACDSGVPAGPPVATMRCVLASGVTIEAVADGAIRIIPDAPRESPITVYNPLTRQITRVSGLEVSRVVLLDGTVLVAFDDGTRMNLFPNGNTAVLHEGHWLITNAAGRRVLKDPNGKVTPLVLSLVTSNTDTETLSKLTTREDGVVTVHYDDGRTLAQHIDGTRMWRGASRDVIEVEADGLPRVFASPRMGTGDDVPLPQRSCLAVEAVGGLTVTLVPHEYVTVSHPATGFAGALDLKTLHMHCDPGTGSTRYVLDAAFGGMRVADGSNSLHVTPFGRTIIRPANEDLPVAPTEEPGVKQVIDVFMRTETLSPAFADAMAAAGFPIDDALHMMPAAPVFRAQAEADASSASLQAPPRSRQLRDKEQGCASLLSTALVPSAGEEAPVSVRAPLLFVCGSDGALELVRRSDSTNFLRAAMHRSNLLFTDVHREPVAVLKDHAAELGADGVVAIPPAAPSLDGVPKMDQDGGSGEAAAPGATDASTHTASSGPAASFAMLGESVIVSVAPPQPIARSGIPKILVDLRRASARSGPVSVAAFLHELKQGPQLATKAASADPSLGGGGAVTVETRHFVTVDPSVWTGGGNAATRTELPTASAGEACYERALFHLARAIPPVIAAQLSLKPQHRLGSTTRGRRTNTGGSRVSRNGRNLPPRRTAGEAPEEDAEFANQMEALEAREKANRKPWPTPISDRKQKIVQTQQAAMGNFWQSPIGSDVVETVVAENEKYKAANGFRKVPVPQYNSSGESLSHSLAARNARASTEGARSAEAPGAATQQAGLSQVPTPPRVPKVAKPSGANSSTLRSNAAHVSPANMLATSLPAQPTGKKMPKAPPTLAATPHSLHLGTLVANHRYAAELKLSNVGTAAARYRVVVEPAEAAKSVHVSVPQLALAPGMSTALVIEVDGTQAEGTLNATVTAVAIGGAVQIPLQCITVADSERGSAGHPRPGVRILGATVDAPALGATAKASGFVPGTTKRAKRPVPAPMPDTDSD